MIRTLRKYPSCGPELPGASHLTVVLPLGPSYNQGLTMESLQVAGPHWVMDSVRDSKRREEVLYHSRLLTTPE